MGTATTPIETEKRSTEPSRSKLVPTLRFKEFEDNLAKVGFADVGKILIGLTHKPEYISSGRPFLSSKNISGGFIDFDNIKYISEEKFQSMPQSTKPKRGDILFTRVGSNLGNPIVFDVDKEFGIFVSLGVYRVNEKASNYFMKNWMDTAHFWRQLEQKVAGGAKDNLNTTWLKEFKLNLPTLPEQQKIASFLSVVDEKIQQLTKKKELLEQYKKGVMQQLFSGETRFRDGNGSDYPDWEDKKRLGEIGKILMGQSPDSGSYNEDAIGYWLIQGNADIKNRVTTPRQWTSEPTKICKVGDIILTVRAPVGAVSKSNHNACIGRGVCSILNNKYSKQEFLYQFLLSYEEKWGRLEQGSTFTAVSGSDIKTLKLNVPCLEEQQKIATYLSSIDTKIESVTHQITQTQTFKKGLLQQMFV